MSIELRSAPLEAWYGHPGGSPKASGRIRSLDYEVDAAWGVAVKIVFFPRDEPFDPAAHEQRRSQSYRPHLRLQVRHRVGQGLGKPGACRYQPRAQSVFLIDFHEMPPIPYDLNHDDYLGDDRINAGLH